MLTPTIWPSSLQDFLIRNWGELTNLETLKGLTHAQIFRLSFETGKLILKVSSEVREYTFYQSIAPLLHKQGVELPVLYWQGYEPPFYWLLLENIPLLFPRERWEADPKQLSLLATLHRAIVPSELWLPVFYRPKWNHDINQKMLSLLDNFEAQQLSPILEEICNESQFLFEPVSAVSCDPNMLNWGLREDGTPVLFDWERFSFGSPMLDVAILVPGLLNWATFSRFAAVYLQLTRPAYSQGELQVFSRALVIGKIWSMVEFMSMYEEGSLDLRENVLYLTELVPTWVQSIYSFL